MLTDVGDILHFVEGVLLSRVFTPLERLVFQQSWLGHSYAEMATGSGYECNYLKEVGSNLWHELSSSIGIRVTKKNLQIVINQYLSNQPNVPLNQQSSFLNQPNNALRKDQQAQWNLTTALETGNEFPLREPARAFNLDLPSTSLPTGSPLYIDRPPIEETAYAELQKPGGMIWIKAPWKMGKSSLLNRLISHSVAQRYRTVYLDLQEADETVFASLDRFLRWFCANATRQLNFVSRLDDYWNGEIGAKVSCKIYFEEYLLKQVNAPLVLAINEANQIFKYSKTAQDFFAMLRVWHEHAPKFETWQKLRLIVVQSDDLHAPLQFSQSLFTSGLLITLPAFTPEQIQELGQRYGLAWGDAGGIQAATSLATLLGGHPYLVNIALHHLRCNKVSLAELLRSASVQAKIYGDYLRSYLTLLEDESALKLALQTVVNTAESAQLNPLDAYHLESLGLVQLDGTYARPTCELYRLYFQKQLEAIKPPRVASTVSAQHSRERNHEQKGVASSLFIADRVNRSIDRYCFHEYLEAQWQTCIKTCTPLSLLLCRIDYFKFYKAAYGHQAEKACIEIISDVIHQHVAGQADCITRYKDATFAVVLQQLNEHDITAIAENIRKTFKTFALPLDQSKIGGFPNDVLTVSLGISSRTPDSRLSSLVLIDMAQEALNQAKRQGGDRVHWVQHRDASNTSWG